MKFLKWLFVGLLSRLASAPVVGGDTNVWGTGLLNWLGQAIDTATGQLLDNAVARQTAVSVSGTTYTIGKSDQGKFLNALGNSPTTITVPTDANITGGAWDSISTCTIRQGGGGQVAVVGASGVTINSRGGLTHTAGQFAHIMLVRIGANNYDLVGDLA